jgi:hypothetical protein
MRFVIRLEDWQTMASPCREFGISRKTGYKIFERYEQCGLAWTLSDDGKTLTKNIHRSGPRGDSDQQYVLENNQGRWATASSLSNTDETRGQKADLAPPQLMRYAHMFMRRSLLKFGALAIVAICLGGHVSELFDRWENTMISGNDVDYTCVFVAAVAGAMIVFAGLLGKLFQVWPKPVPIPPLDHRSLASSVPESVTSAHSPPLALRV